MKFKRFGIIICLFFTQVSILVRAISARTVSTGIDVLIRDGFSKLSGKRVGLLTNQTGRSKDGSSTIDILYAAPNMKLVALFSPEHGIRGTWEELDIADSYDKKTGLKIYSLYGKTHRLTDNMLEGVDTIVIDLQDIGVRFYTYIATMAYVLEEAAKRKISVFILDRPNPINGNEVEGPISEPSTEIISYFCMPVRHGMTMGELALLFNAENKINAQLTIIPVENWHRDYWFDATGISWVNPSPNIRNLNQATLYPGIGAIEYSNISVGRGTEQPFEQIGAPWIDGQVLAKVLNDRKLPGVRFYPVIFFPKSSMYANEKCRGLFILITNRSELRPVLLGLEIASALMNLYPDKYTLSNHLHPQRMETWQLLGSAEAFRRIKNREDPAIVAASWTIDEARWRQLRSKYLLY